MDGARSKEPWTKNRLPDETTRLMMMPSAHSTDQSSRENLVALESASVKTADELSREYGHRHKGYQSYWPADGLISRDDERLVPAQAWRTRRQTHINTVLVLSFLVISLSTLYILWKEGVFMQKEMRSADADFLACRAPLSRLDPVRDLGLAAYRRPKASSPFPVLDEFSANNNRAIPTNSWYQNLLLLREGEEPSAAHRAYAVPYVLDAAGPIPGLRMHTNHMSATQNVLQMIVNNRHGITLGAAAERGPPSPGNRAFFVKEMTQLAISLGWKDYGMEAPIVKGMPYSTMSYKSLEMVTRGGVLSPAIATEAPIYERVYVDQKGILPCVSGAENTIWVEKELEFYVPESDFTWLVFVSEPVQVSCRTYGSTSILRAISGHRLAGEIRPFFFRAALFKPCTKGLNPVYCHQEQMYPTALHMGQGSYGEVLRSFAHLYPGPRSSVSYKFDETETEASLLFNWDVQVMRGPLYPELREEEVNGVIAYALPHHLDMMSAVRSPSNDIYCAASLVGPACLIEGPVWTLYEQMPGISFRAERPPQEWAMPSLLKSLEKDIEFRLPDYFERGAGDTYFSGKMLAKLGRILMITEEVRELCGEKPHTCANATLPTAQHMANAVAALRSSVEVWINGTAETPFVYDTAWGGVASCGCLFDGETGTCDNKFPDCPAFSNAGLNFGNAFYNDMHFHYGYHIFGAAVVSHFDPSWGREHFDRVLLLVRNIANPSEEDEHYPIMRHKDVYQGHSWASGIATSPLNGRNQESSSESLAAYEAVALYGKVMADVFAVDGSRQEHNSAVEVRRVGKLMTASELRSAKKYYHVKRDENEAKIFPDSYTPHVVGIMWQTMAQFQTWFGNAPYLATGIQLLPLTPIAGQRDGVTWAKEMYPDFEKSCSADLACEEQGWSVLQLGALSTVGHAKLAFSRARLLPAEVFESAGGNGHSLTNTLWYIATREPLDEPLPLTDASTVPQSGRERRKFPKESVLTDCYRPETCTAYVLDTVVELYTCRQRIAWLIEAMGKSQKDACVQVAAIEFPGECGKCNPLADYAATLQQAKEEAARRCPPCTAEQCHSDLNRCPVYDTTYVCTHGPNEGGCSDAPWSLAPGICAQCCNLTHCPKISPLETTTTAAQQQEGGGELESNCPVCTPDQCQGNLCPVHVAPYFCVDGQSEGGCSTRPWSLHDGQCQACCKVPLHCSAN